MARQPHLPGLEPGYLRIEMEWTSDRGWIVTTTPAATRQFVTAAGQEEYAGLSWDEAVQIVGDVLDCIVPADRGQAPF